MIPFKSELNYCVFLSVLGFIVFKYCSCSVFCLIVLMFFFYYATESQFKIYQMQVG